MSLNQEAIKRIFMSKSQPETNNLLWTNRQVVHATLFVVVVGIAFYLLYRFSQIIFILVVAMVLGTAIRPAVDWLNRRGIPRPAGVIFLYLGLFCLAGLLILLAFPMLSQQVTAFNQNLPVYYANLSNSLLNSSIFVVQQIGIRLANANLQAPPPAGGSASQSLDRVAQSLTYINLIGHSLITLTAVFILGFYWTNESDQAIRNLLLLTPLKKREKIRLFLKEVEAKVGAFIFGESLMCLAIGGMALIAYLIIGLPYALILAVIAGTLELVPFFGPFLGAIPAIIVALSTDPTRVIWVVVSILAIHGLEAYLLAPRVMRHSVGVNPLITLLALSAFTTLFGLVGAFLAVPMAAVLQLLANRFILDREQARELDGRDQLNLLRYEAQNLAQDARKQLRVNSRMDGREETIVNSLEAISMDLERALAQFEGDKEVF
jgi:predicted PurR-regulated permease PerM